MRQAPSEKMYTQRFTISLIKVSGTLPRVRRSVGLSIRLLIGSIHMGGYGKGEANFQNCSPLSAPSPVALLS